MKKTFTLIFIATILTGMVFQNAYADVTKTVGASGADYATLKAAFDKINDGTLTGAVTLQIIDNTTENLSAVLYHSGYGGSSSYTSVLIYPTVTGKTITGSGLGAVAMISLNGADNVTIDGRLNQGGATDLTITNPSLNGSATTITFINSAENNLVTYCNIKGSGPGASTGIILFSTASAGNANDNNTISYNNITSDAAGRPFNGIASVGITGYDNEYNNISNNNIYNIITLGSTTASRGIFLSTFTQAWTITGNSIYEESAITGSNTGLYNAICIVNTSADYGSTVTGNYIGGTAPQCGGISNFTKTGNNNVFVGIIITVKQTASASSIQGNTIKNISWTNSLGAAWTGISVTQGPANIGTIAGNTIGSTTSTGSVSITSGANSSVYGISMAGAAVINCNNNIIGSITAANGATFASNIYGIYKTTTTSASISNNTIGSSTIGNCINASSASTSNIQSVYGIFNSGNAGANMLTIDNNIVANLTNGTTNSNTGTAGRVNGIASSNGVNTITNNIIHDLTIANANSSLTNTASVCGISLSVANDRTVAGNTIYNLFNTYASFTGSVIGLYFTGGATEGDNVVSLNFIHSLSVNSGSTSAEIDGIKIEAGFTYYFNNIISLGGNTESTIYGIYETGAVNNDNFLYFNTIHIFGEPATGVLNSYALYSASGDNVRNFTNNLFSNQRTNNGASGSHYAVYISTATGLTIDYNDYFAPGTGGVFGNIEGSDVSDLTYWQAATGQDGNSLDTDPGFALAGGTAVLNYVPTTHQGISMSSGTPPIATDFTGNPRAVVPTMGALEYDASFNIEVWIGGVKQASYFSLNEAFDRINDGTHTGAITIKILKNTTETASAMLNSSGTGSASYTSVHVYPNTSGITITGDFNAPLIDLNGSDNVNIDGRVGGTGSTKSLTISNPNTGTSAATIRFINSAENNTINYCTIEGSGTGTGRGVISFETAISGNGNDGNTIQNNNITSASGGRPVNTILSAGSLGFENSGNTIDNNQIYDFFNPDYNSYGVVLTTRTTDWTVSGNSFYETTAFAPNANHEYIALQINNTEGNNFTVSGNSIGGQASGCGGSPWTKNNTTNDAFIAISMNVGTTTVSSVQNNTIKNFGWSNSADADWTGIRIGAGDVNIGTSTGNTIGASTGTGSITVTSAGTGVSVSAISISSANTVDCQNNIIGSITAANSATYATDIYGIIKTAVAGTTTISNNTVGGTTASSINSSSASTANPQSVYGIYTLGTGNTTISGNTIKNLRNGTTNTSGIVDGLYFGGGVATNSVSRNFIHSLVADGGSTTAAIYGIKIAKGTTTYSNNIVSLGGNTTSTIYGIYETGAATYDNNIYFNSVYIAGVPTSGALNSYAFYSNATTNTRNFRNNIFANVRSNTSATGKHYAAYFNYGSSTDLTFGYNDYYTPGTGGVLGYYNGADVTSLPLIPGMDAYSLSVNPNFISAGSTTATDYKITTDLVGIPGSGITSDYGNVVTRNTVYPTMGAWEKDMNKWKGGISTDWNDGDNWTSLVVPAADANIIFDDNPLHNCILDQDRSVTSIYNGTTFDMIINGHKLTVKGFLDFTNVGAQIDASATSSNLEFAGTSVQNIPAGSLIDNKVYDLTVNNPKDVILNGTLRLLHTITNTSGWLDAYTNSPTVIYEGTSAQTIHSGTYLGEHMNNLTISNSVGVTLLNNFEVEALDVTAASFTVNAGIYLIAHGNTTLRVPDALWLKSDEFGNAKFIDNGTISYGDGSGTAAVELYLTTCTGTTNNLRCWHYVSPPVIDARAGVFNGDFMKSYDEPNSRWSPYYTHSGTLLNKTQGYAVSAQGDGVRTFHGQLNSGELTTTPSLTRLGSAYPGFNLVGNPYPSPIDLNSLDIIWTNVEQKAYFLDQAAGNYKVWPAGTPYFTATQYPLSMQGFFVYVKSGFSTGTIKFTNDARTTSSDHIFFKNTVPDLLRLKAEGSSGMNDEIIICFRPDAVESYDEKLDCFKMFGDQEAPQLYSVTPGASKLTINSLPFTGLTTVVPLEFSVDTNGTGSYSITASELESFRSGTTITLEDKKESKTQELIANPVYSFNYTDGDDPARFLLHFYNPYFGINDSGRNADLQIYSNGKDIYVKDFTGNPANGDLFVYDIMGREVSHQRFGGIPMNKFTFNLPEGYYIVKVITKDKTYNWKVYLD